MQKLTFLSPQTSWMRDLRASVAFSVAVLSSCAAERQSDDLAESSGELASSGLVTCVSDGDCDAGHFCDRDGCVAINIEAANYGRDCNESNAFRCGAYRCQTERCRSCISDQQCGDGAVCVQRTDHPGWGCGRPNLVVSDPDEPPPPNPSVP